VQGGAAQEARARSCAAGADWRLPRGAGTQDPLALAETPVARRMPPSPPRSYYTVVPLSLLPAAWLAGLPPLKAPGSLGACAADARGALAGLAGRGPAVLATAAAVRHGLRAGGGRARGGGNPDARGSHPLLGHPMPPSAPAFSRPSRRPIQPLRAPPSSWRATRCSSRRTSRSRGWRPAARRGPRRAHTRSPRVGAAPPPPPAPGACRAAEAAALACQTCPLSHPLHPPPPGTPHSPPPRRPPVRVGVVPPLSGRDHHLRRPRARHGRRGQRAADANLGGEERRARAQAGRGTVAPCWRLAGALLAPSPAPQAPFPAPPPRPSTSCSRRARRRPGTAPASSPTRPPAARSSRSSTERCAARGGDGPAPRGLAKQQPAGGRLLGRQQGRARESKPEESWAEAAPGHVNGPVEGPGGGERARSRLGGRPGGRTRTCRAARSKPPPRGAPRQFPRPSENPRLPPPSPRLPRPRSVSRRVSGALSGRHGARRAPAGARGLRQGCVIAFRGSGAPRGAAQRAPPPRPGRASAPWRALAPRRAPAPRALTARRRRAALPPPGFLGLLSQLTTVGDISREAFEGAAGRGSRGAGGAGRHAAHARARAAAWAPRCS
jgi:hypothetical protein